MQVSYANIKVTENEGGGYLAECLDIRGAIAEGDTPNEAVSNLISVIDVILESQKEMAAG